MRCGPPWPPPARCGTGSIRNSRPFTLLALLLETGIKKGECLGIHVNHIDLNSVDGPILFVRYGDVRKRYKERKLGLSAAWVEAYREYQAHYTPVDRVFPWSPRRLEYLLEDVGKAAGLSKHLSFDMCRWTSALNDYQSGSDKNKIRQKMGNLEDPMARSREETSPPGGQAGQRDLPANPRALTPAGDQAADGAALGLT